MQLVIAHGSVRLHRRVPEAVLIAQLFINGVIYFIDGLFLGSFKKASPGSLGHLLKDFLSVWTRFLCAWRIAAAPPASPAHSAASHVRTAVSSPVSIAFFVREQDAIHEGIGALRRRDGLLQIFFAAVVHAIGENNDGFAAFLLFHQFVGGQKNRVVE